MREGTKCGDGGKTREAGYSRQSVPKNACSIAENIFDVERG
jgi:hypothetical protein